jgi:hypothetical protein
MADDGTNLFVKTDSGSVAVIDPDKSSEARRLSLGAGGLCQGSVPMVAWCGADARADTVADEVWVVTASELVALEKEGLKETARIPIEGELCSVTVDEDRVFVVGTEPLLTEVDATTHQVSRVITDANSECGDIHAAFSSIG